MEQALTQGDANDKLFNSTYMLKENETKPSFHKLGNSYVFLKRVRKLLEIFIITIK